MKTGKELFEAYQKHRDVSGNKIDSYAQDLSTYWVHASMQGKEAVFYKLLEKAERENKQISFKEPGPDIFYDDYPVEDLILTDKEF